MVDSPRRIGVNRRRMHTGQNPPPEAAPTKVSRFVAGTGFAIDAVSVTSLRAHAYHGSDHQTEWGTVRGGVYASLVECAGGAGAGRAVADRGQIAVGVRNGTDFLRVSSGGHVDIAAEALFQGRGQQLWDVVITQSETEEVLARGQLRHQNIPRPSTPPP